MNNKEWIKINSKNICLTPNIIYHKTTTKYPINLFLLKFIRHFIIYLFDVKIKRHQMLTGEIGSAV